MASNDGIFFRLPSYFELPFFGLNQDRVPQRLFSDFPQARPSGLVVSSLNHGAHRNAASTVESRCLDFPPSHEEVDNEDYQQHGTDAASHVGTPIIVAASAAEKQQQNQNDQNKVHIEILQIRDVTISHVANQAF
jgi:hypothetical protein